MKKISMLLTILSLLLIGSNILLANMIDEDNQQIYNSNRLVDSNLTNEDLNQSNNNQYDLAPILVAPTNSIDTSVYELNDSPRNYLRDDYDRRQPEIEYRQDMHRRVEGTDRGIGRGGRR